MNTATRKLYERKAEVIAATGHPVRLAIIEFLNDGEQCVCDIAEYVASERSNVSRHLAVLLKAGIVEHRKSGLKMLYSLKTPCVLNFMECVTNVLREQARENHAVLKNL
ncbi:MAG: metalloregulator ArsR/SmtB family transcription factor [Planctomycetota bacterium]|nr:metalloregulator ArsR/SmtB family transcription factor [Planctomycetota bacterium]